jgi:hypothetical protein
MNENGYSLSDIVTATGRNGDGAFGGDWGAWIILFLLFGLFGRGGYGGFGGGFGNGGDGGGNCCCTRGAISEGFAMNNLQSGINAIQQGICDSTYALNNTINSGFYGVDRGINGISAQLAQCCCDTRTAIADVRYQMATDTCGLQNTIQNTTRDVLENNNNNTRAILDFLVNDKISTLQAENQNLRLAASQSNQNAVLMAAMDANKAEILRRTGAECPTAAYIVQPPQPVTFPINNCGTFAGFGSYNNGCGCGC